MAGKLEDGNPFDEDLSARGNRHLLLGTCRFFLVRRLPFSKEVLESLVEGRCVPPAQRVRQCRPRSVGCGSERREAVSNSGRGAPVSSKPSDRCQKKSSSYSSPRRTAVGDRRKISAAS